MWFSSRKKVPGQVGESSSAGLESASAGDLDSRPTTPDSLFAESAGIASDLHEHLLQYGGREGVLPNRDPLLAQQQPDGAYAWPYGLFEEAVDKDAHLAALLAQRKAAVLGWERRVVPADDSPRARQIADFVEAALEGIGGPCGSKKGGGFERDLSELLDGIAYGFAVSEVLWERKASVGCTRACTNGVEERCRHACTLHDTGENARATVDGWGQAAPLQECVVPAELRSRHPRRFIFALKADGSFAPRLLTASAPVTGEALPPRKLLVFAPYGRYENPYGHPALRSIWWLSCASRHYRSVA